MQNKEDLITKRIRNLVDHRVYREAERATVIQGSKNIRMLLDNGIKLNKIGLTAPQDWFYHDEIQPPAIDVIEKPDEWPAKHYYVNSIDVTRKMLDSTNPGHHQLWAEAAINSQAVNDLDLEKVRRVLVIDKPQSDTQLGELIRTARSLAFDMGFLCNFGGRDVYSPEALRASRLQSMLFPSENHRLVSTAVDRAKAMGCTPIFMKLLPERECENSQVGVPKFWRMNGRNVDMSELQGKVAVVVSPNDQAPAAEDDICVSIPLAVSPLGPKALSTMNFVHAATISMATIVSLDQESKLSQPVVLEPTYIEEMEGRMVTNALAAKMRVPRPKTPRQQDMIDRKKAIRNFRLEWEKEELELKKRRGMTPEEEAEEERNQERKLHEDNLVAKTKHI